MCEPVENDALGMRRGRPAFLVMLDHRAAEIVDRRLRRRRLQTDGPVQHPRTQRLLVVSPPSGSIGYLPVALEGYRDPVRPTTLSMTGTGNQRVSSSSSVTARCCRATE